MCFVVQNHLGKGARCAPPLHPPGLGSVRALSPSRASRTYRRSFTRGRLRSPCTHRHGGRACPQDPSPFHGDDFIETKGKEHSRCPSLEPSHRPRSVSRPWNPDQPYADWMSPLHGNAFSETNLAPVGSVTALCHLTLKFLLSLLPIRHYAAQEIKEFASVMGMLDMAKLVRDDVIDSLSRCAD